jgi:hypothetical protein
VDFTNFQRLIELGEGNHQEEEVEEKFELIV